MTNHTYIIAEAGVNHNGSLDLAKQLVDAAKGAGADAVKFQTYKTEALVTQNAKQAAYQVENLGEATSQFDMLKKLELSYPQFKELKSYCDEAGIEFLSTPFDFESVDFLVDELHMKQVKIPSGELTNSPLIHYIATKQKPIILSTGMATMDDIHEALSFIAFGLVYPSRRVNVEEVHNFYQTIAAKKVLRKNVTVLHCTTEYPAPIETINLRAMEKMIDELNLSVGYSDHTQGIAVSFAAVTLGANIIEKHFTLEKTMPGPDHLASLEPKELKELVQGIRAIEKSLGVRNKLPNSAELENRKAARKSLVAKSSISIGETFTTENITIKRPGNGMPPKEFWPLLGNRASKHYEEDDLLDE